ncbi:hypothetical protein QBC32DRAFT_218041 [Pseudoneurospora amorphoporcata]|uniref:Uncharacterized protein n=1 Tax=Pseudoneurospora amorphoporcata TaxID=241081 RepID=A0AAN6SEF9_9PEZI|nr:hypothetical protein QBC32DRAFT_218041 [Pseudoneurospora amorphoporcata]
MNLIEVHTYHHSAPRLEMVEINTTLIPRSLTEPVEDLGAFASSVDYNDFERFLDEDRMWGVHRPALRKPLVIFSKAVQKEQVVPSVKPERKSGKEVAADASGASTSYIPSHATQQSDDIISKRERKLSTDTDVSIETCQTVETAKATDTVLTTPATAPSHPHATPELECNVQPPIVPRIIITEPHDIPLQDVDDAQLALEGQGDIPYIKALPPFSSLYDYGYLNLTRQKIEDLWIMTILNRPGCTTKYARLSCGFWYIMEDKKNVRMMLEPEYEDFLAWIGEDSEEHEYVADTYEEEEEDDEEDWAELLRWKKRYELGRGWGIVKTFNHPDYADRKYALGNDDRWYFEYNEKYRGLMQNELDLFNSRREAGSSDLVEGAEEQTSTNRLGLATIAEEEEEEC